ncbi:MAG: hypothetical protein ACRD2D_02495, partial [Terriglobales bacterium]
MEFFRDTEIDFLGKKWYFLTLTMILFVVGMVSLAIHRGPDMGIDFTGGTQMDVKFIRNVPTEQIRSGLITAKLGDVTIQPVNGTKADEVLISTPLSTLNQADLEKSKAEILNVLYQVTGVNPNGKQDINNVGVQTFTDWLLQKDPLGYVGLGQQEATTRYTALAQQLLSERRDKQFGGVFPNFEALA